MKWICSACATNRGLVLGPPVVTWHLGLCEICLQQVGVTDMMHFHHHTGADLPLDRGTKP